MKANDPKAVAERERKDRERQKQFKADLAEALKSPATRRVFWYWLEKAGVWRSVFSTNALQMANNEGNRNLGLNMMADIASVEPKALLEMMQTQEQDTND